jgi:hypothetical protein
MSDALTVIPPRRAAECDGAAHRDLPGRAHSGRRNQRVQNCGYASGCARLAALPQNRGRKLLWRERKATPFARLQRDA